MDPDATLNDLRNLIAAFEENDDTEFARIELIEKFNALDAWLQSGGFLPDAWENAVPVEAVPVEPHDEIWCDRCANDEHNFVGEPLACLCCGKEKS